MLKCSKSTTQESKFYYVNKVILPIAFLPSFCYVNNIDVLTHSSLIPAVREWNRRLQKVIRLDCPSCKRDSYSASVEPFRPCPYCGAVYSGKYGAERRNEKRILKELPVAFSHVSAGVEAMTSDAAARGVGLKFSSTVRIPTGGEIKLYINNSPATVQVIWTRNNEDFSVSAGCRIVSGSLGI